MTAWNVRITRGHHSRCAPEWHWLNLRGQWSGYLLWLILKGDGTLQTESAKYPLHTGQCFVLRMRERIEGAHDPSRPLVVPWIHYEYVDRRGRVFDPEPLPAEHRLAGNVSFLGDLFDRAIDAFLDHAPDTAAHWLKAALLEIAQADRRPAQSGPELDQAQRIERLCVTIRENPEVAMRVEDMARQMHCTPDHFCRLFKRVKGETPRAFMIRTRIEHAKSLLRFSGHSVGRIADMLGYRDVYYFSRQFKEQAGMSPRAYRQPRRG